MQNYIFQSKSSIPCSIDPQACISSEVKLLLSGESGALVKYYSTDNEILFLLSNQTVCVAQLMKTFLNFRSSGFLPFPAYLPPSVTNSSTRKIRQNTEIYSGPVAVSFSPADLSPSGSCFLPGPRPFTHARL